MKGEIKQYAHMSVRYTDESVTDDQGINPTNNIVRRTLVVNNYCFMSDGQCHAF